MGGSDFINDEVRRILEGGDMRQRAIVHSKEGALDDRRSAAADPADS